MATPNKSEFKPSPLGPIPEDWDCSTIGELVKFSGGSQPPLKTFLYKEKEGYVRLIQTRDYRTDKYKTYIPISEARKICEENDIMIGRYGPPLFQIFRGLQGAYNVALIKAIPNEQKVDREYCYYFLTRPELRSYIEGLSQRSGGQTGVEIDKLNDYPFPLPSLKEQQSLASTLSTWDKAIEKTTQLITAKEQRKKWLMQQLLTGKKRLNGDNGLWEEVKMGDIFDRVARRNTELNSNVVTISAQKGFINQGDYFNKIVASDILDNYFLVHKGEFCYNKSYSNGYPWGATKRLNDFEKAVVTTLYICFGIKDNQKNSGDFFEHFFESGILDKGLMKIAHEGGRAHGLLNVTPTDFLDLRITVPQINEQIAIANVFQTADKEINLLKRKLEAYKEQKKGLMQVLLTGKARLKF